MKFRLLIILLLIVSFLSAKEAVKIPPPTYADVAYGEHKKNRLDYWRVESEEKTPVVIYVHGGDWRVGNKHAVVYQDIGKFFKNGISVASINYRSIDDAPFPAPYNDGARAIQFLRLKSEEWNIDKEKIGIYGSDSGGTIALWTAFTDDKSRDWSRDEVEKQSSKPWAAAGFDSITSLNPYEIVPWTGPAIFNYSAIPNGYGYESYEELYIVRKRPYYDSNSPYSLVDKQDATVYLEYILANTEHREESSGLRTSRHPIFGIKLKEKMDNVGLECSLNLKAENYVRGRYTNVYDFFIDKLKKDAVFHPEIREEDIFKGIEKSTVEVPLPAQIPTIEDWESDYESEYEGVVKSVKEETEEDSQQTKIPEE